MAHIFSDNRRNLGRRYKFPTNIFRFEKICFIYQQVFVCNKFRGPVKFLIEKNWWRAGIVLILTQLIRRVFIELFV